MTMYAVNYKGLRKRSDYDELVDYILFKQPKIKYPDRTAKFIRESPQLSNLLDGEGFGLEQLKQQQLNKMKEEAKQNAIIESASESGGTASHLRSLAKKPTDVIFGNAVDSDYSDRMRDFSDDVESAISDHDAKHKQKVDKYSSMFVNDPGHDYTRQLEELMKFNLDFTPPSSSVSQSGKNGNGNGNGGNTQPATESSSSAAAPQPPPGLVLIPPGSSSSSLPASAYPSLDPPAPMPTSEKDYHDFINMKPNDLRKYAKDNFGITFPIGTTKNDMIDRILKESKKSPDQQTSVIPKASAPKKRQLSGRKKRIDTPVSPEVNTPFTHSPFHGIDPRDI